MIAAAIIAGGQARRFGGADKCRLVVEGDTIIARQLAVLREVAGEIFVVVDREERARAFDDLHLRVETDRLPGTGALGAIFTALDATAADAVVIVASDLPFLDAGLLRRLIERSAGADGAWVATARGAEPLMACYRQSAKIAMRRALDLGRLKAADLATALDIRAIDDAEVAAFGPPARLLANVNAPEDYARITGAVRHEAAIVPQRSNADETSDEAG